MKYAILFATLLCAAGLAFGGSSANAQATRTWVSGVGDDANPCSRTAPCKTFAGAISKTAPAGEINCLDPGGFGALTITKSITISCQAGTAGVLVSGTNGIVISAATTDVVHLSGLDFEGIGTGLSGVNIIQAAVVRIDHSTIRGFTVAGINVAPSAASGGVKVDVIDSIVSDNTGTGILNKPTSGSSVRTMIERSLISGNGGDGVMVNGTQTTGSLKVLVTNSVSSHNTGGGYVSFSNTAVAQLMIDASSAIDNSNGIAANGAAALVRFTRMSITSNGTGVNPLGGSSILSYGTNSVDGNGTDGTFGTVAQR